MQYQFYRSFLFDQGRVLRGRKVARGGRVIEGLAARRDVRTILAAIVLLALSACASSYKGLGDLNVGADGAPLDEPIFGSPTLTLRGERQVSPRKTSLNFDWPVDTARLSRGFLLGQKRPHWGLDLAAPRGTPILASEEGYVIYTGRGFKGYGKLIVIEHGEEWATLYAHLDSIEVSEGDRVTRGQRIGTMGRTGRASGVHLHFEIRENRQPVNPLQYLPQGF